MKLQLVIGAAAVAGALAAVYAQDLTTTSDNVRRKETTFDSSPRPHPWKSSIYRSSTGDVIIPQSVNAERTEEEYRAGAPIYHTPSPPSPSSGHPPGKHPKALKRRLKNTIGTQDELGRPSRLAIAKRRLFLQGGFIFNMIFAIALMLAFSIPQIMIWLKRKPKPYDVRFYLYSQHMNEVNDQGAPTQNACPLAVTIAHTNRQTKTMFVAGGGKGCGYIPQGGFVEGYDEAHSSLIESIRITAIGSLPLKFNLLVLELSSDLQPTNPDASASIAFGANLVEYCAKQVWPQMNLERPYRIPPNAAMSGAANTDDPLGWMIMSNKLEHWNEFVIHKPYQYIMYSTTIMQWYQTGQNKNKDFGSLPNDAAIEICRTFRPGQGWHEGEFSRFECATCSNGAFYPGLQTRLWFDMPYRLPHETPLFQVDQRPPIPVYVKNESVV